MYAVIGPVYAKANGYAFDVWVPRVGLLPGFAYRCVQDACYARRAEVSGGRRNSGSVPALVCETVDEFVSEVAAVTARPQLSRVA